jgi:hypothetical protein
MISANQPFVRERRTPRIRLAWSSWSSVDLRILKVHCECETDCQRTDWVSTGSICNHWCTRFAGFLRPPANASECRCLDRAGPMQAAARRRVSGSCSRDAACPIASHQDATFPLELRRRSHVVRPRWHARRRPPRALQVGRDLFGGPTETYAGRREELPGERGDLREEVETAWRAVFAKMLLLDMHLSGSKFTEMVAVELLNDTVQDVSLVWLYGCGRHEPLVRRGRSTACPGAFARRPTLKSVEGTAAGNALCDGSSCWRAPSEPEGGVAGSRSGLPDFRGRGNAGSGAKHVKTYIA